MLHSCIIYNFIHFLQCHHDHKMNKDQAQHQSSQAFQEHASLIALMLRCIKPSGFHASLPVLSFNSSLHFTNSKTLLIPRLHNSFTSLTVRSMTVPIIIRHRRNFSYYIFTFINKQRSNKIIWS